MNDDLKEQYSKLYQLCGDIIQFAFHGDYSNGNEAYGIDEGRVRGIECLESYEKEWKALSK